MIEKNNKYENKTMWVGLLTAFTMVVEIIFGITGNCSNLNTISSTLWL